jgi:adenine-specific DNA-methyltransferase
MYPRLRLARNLLRDDGVIFISIDDNELANMRKVCDEIFGNENFRNTFITRRYDKNLNRQFIDSGLQTLNVGFEYIIAYSKSNKFLFNPVYKEAEEKRQSTGYWKGFWNAADRPTMRYPLLGVEPSEGQWKWKKETAYEAVENYERYMEKFSHKMSLEEYWDQTGKVLKFIKRNKNGSGRNLGVEHWVPPSSGVLRNTNLLDILASKSTEEIKNLFDFPKNIELLKVLLMFSSKEDDLVMDFFAGSCSFAHATLELNKEDSNKRKFIMVQLPEPCGDTTEAKKSGCETIAEIGKERLRRVIYRIKGENSKSNRGLGFRVLHVDSSNMKNVYYTPDKITKRDLFGLVDNIKKDRTDEDLLFQVLLDWGVDLTLPIQSESISGKKVFFVDQDALAACFEPNLDEEFIKMLAERKPLRAVFRDSGFGSDSTKINL